MKRILKLSSVFALACAALLYTGCAKDYTGDLSELQKQQTEQGEQIASQSQQLASQAEQIAALDASSKELQGELEDLEAALEEASEAIVTAKQQLEAADQANKELIDALTQRVATLEAFKADTQTEIETIKTTITNIQSAISEKGADITALKAQVSEIVEKVGTIDGKMTAYQEAISALQNTVATLQGKVTENFNTLNEKIEAVKESAQASAATLQTVLGDVASIKAAFANYYTKAQVDAYVKTLQDNIDALDARTSAEITAKVKELQAKDETLQGLITELSGKIDTQIALLQAKDSELDGKIDKEISNLQTQINTVTSEITTIKDAIVSLQESVKTLVADVTVLKTTVENLQAADAVLQSNIEAVKNALEVAKTELKAADAANEGLIKALEARVVLLENEVAALKTKDAELQGSITTINAQIESLNKGVKTNAEGIAANVLALEKTNENLAGLVTIVETNKALFESFKSETYADITLLNSDIDALEAQAKTASENITKIYGDIESVNQRFEAYYKKGEVNALVSTLQTNIDNVSAELKEKYNTLVGVDSNLQSQIDALSASLTKEVEERIKGDADAVAEITKQVKNVQDQINTINTTIESIKTAIEGVKADIADVKADVKVLETCVTNLEKADELINQRIDATNNLLAIETAARETGDNTNKSLIDALEKEVDDLQAYDKELKAAIDKINTETIPSLQSDIKSNADAIQKNFTTIVTTAEKLAAVTQLVQTNQTTFEKFEVKTNEAIAALNKTAEALQTQADETEASLEKAWASIADIIATHYTKGEVDGKLTSLETSLKLEISNVDSDLQAKYAELNATITGKIETLDAKLSEQIKAVAANDEERAAKLATEIAAVVKQIGEINEDLDKVWAEIETIKGDITAINVSIDELNTTVAELKSTDEKLAESIELANKNLEAAKAELSKAIAANATNIADLQGRVKTLEDAVTELKAADEAIKKDLSNLTATVNEQAGEIKKIYETSTQTVKDLAGLSTTVELYKKALDSKDEELSAALTALTDRVTKAENSLTNAWTSIKAIETNLATNYYKIGQVDALIEKVEKGYAAADANLQAQIEELKAVDAALDKRIAEVDELIKQEIADRKTADAELEAKVNAVIDEKVTALTEKIEALKSSLEGEISKIQTSIENLKKADETLQENINTVESEYKAADVNLQNQIDVLKGVDKQLQQDIEALEKSVAANTADIATNTKAIADLAAEYAAFVEKTDKAVEVNAANITDLQTRVTALEDEWKGSYEGKIKEIKESIAGLQSQVNDLATRVTSISVLPTTHYEIVNVSVNGKTNKVFVANFQVEPKSAAKNITKDQVSLSFQNGLARGFGFGGTQIYSVTGYDNGSLKVIANWSVPNYPGSNQKEYFALTYNGVDATSEAKYSVTSDYAAATYYANDAQSVDLVKFFYTAADDATVNTEDVQLTTKSGEYTAFSNVKDTPFTGCKKVNYQNYPEGDDALTGFFYELFDSEGAIVPSATFAEITGIPVDLTYSITFEKDRNYYPWKMEEDAEKAIHSFAVYTAAKCDTTIAFKESTDTLRKYVGKWYVKDGDATRGGIVLQAAVNNCPVNYKWHKGYELTGATHTFGTVNLYMYWNYLSYKKEDRYAAVKDTVVLNGLVPSTVPTEAGVKYNWAKVFTESIEDGTNSTFNHDYLAVASGCQTYIAGEFNSYGESVDSVVMKGTGTFVEQETKTVTQYHIRLSSTKDTETGTQNVNDTYEIPVSYTIYEPIAAFAGTSTYSAIGSISKPTQVKVGGLVKNYVDSNWDKLTDGLGYGKLSEVTDENYKLVYDDLYYKLNHSFVGGFASQPNWLFQLVNGETKEIKDKITVVSFTKGTASDNYADTLVFNVKEQVIGYTDAKNIVITTYPYEKEYKHTVTVTTNAPKFYLEYNPKYVSEAGLANVRGIFVSNVYTIDQMYYTHFWNVAGSFEDEDINAIEGKVDLRFADGDYSEAAADEWGSTSGHGAIALNYPVTLVKNGNLYTIPESVKMTWNGYKATYFTASPRIYINGVDATVSTTVRKPVTIVAPDPLRFDPSVNAEVSMNRPAGTAITFNIWNGFNINGTYDNNGKADWTGKLINNNGGWSTSNVYPGCSIEYDNLDTIETTDGKTLYKAHDYTYDGGDGTITIKAESAIAGTFSFYTNVKVYNDFDHCKLDGKVLEKQIKITVVQE